MATTHGSKASIGRKAESSPVLMMKFQMDTALIPWSGVAGGRHVQKRAAVIEYIEYLVYTSVVLLAIYSAAISSFMVLFSAIAVAGTYIVASHIHQTRAETGCGISGENYRNLTVVNIGRN